MKIAYTSIKDPLDINDWSGSTFHIHKALSDSGLQVRLFQKLTRRNNLITGSKKVLYRYLFSKNYFGELDPLRIESYARQVEKSLQTEKFDVIVSPSAYQIAYMKTDIPIVTWRDAPFSGNLNFYPSYSNFCKESIRDGHRLEQSALKKSRISIFSSEWAANSALKNYDVDPAKVKVVPYGANIECDRDVEEIKKNNSKKNFDTCKLLFMGVDWVRKGGETAVKVAERLNQRGLKTELHVVGCRPPGQLSPFVKQYGFVSKKTEKGRKMLDELFKESHFLILPTSAECCAVVFAEACSFGLPNLATDVGGNSTAVRNDKSGKTFSLNADPDEYCDFVLKYMSDKKEYERLSLSSFQEYAERLNWATAGKRVNELIREFCG